MVVVSTGWRALAAMFFSLIAVPSTAAAAAAAEPATLFSALPGFADASLSPNGERLAIVLRGAAGDRVVIIRPVAPNTQPAQVGFADRTVHAVDWASDERLIVRTHFTVDSRNPAHRFFNESRAISMAADGSDQIRLMSRGSLIEENINVTDRIVDLAPNEPDFVYIEAPALPPPLWSVPIGQLEFNLYRANTRNGTSEAVANGRTETARWIMDGNGSVVARIDIPTERYDEIFVSVNGDFRKIATLNDRADNQGIIHGLSEDGRSLAVSARREDNRNALYRLDLATGAWGEALFFDPERDVAEVLTDERTQRVTGVTYFDGELKYHYLNPERQRVQRRLEEVLPGRTVRLVSSSSDGNKHLAEVSGPKNPPTLQLLDLETNRAVVVTRAYPQLEQIALGEVQRIDYANSGGDRLTGNLTLPPGTAEPRNLPLIVTPQEGGGFMSGRFDRLAQFLAHRGYAVFQAGSRDLKGLGDVAGMDELGAWIDATQDDVSSGVRELVARGIVDKGRVCLLGSNDNGYRTLMSAALSPDEYACAISIDAFTDLKEIMRRAVDAKWLPANVLNSTLVRNSRDFSDADLERYSPLNHADSARGSFLIIVGEWSAWRAQGDRMASLLRDAGRSARFVEIADEDGRFQLPSSRTRLLTEIDRFLAENLRP
jgi:dipeptidyl aminopeptidase/acylaminoacyl peptidase